MMYRRILGICALAAGFLFATFSGSTDVDAQSYEYRVWNYPGPSHEPKTLNCGWHDTCVDPQTDGNALDWRNFANTPVNWRSTSSNDQGHHTAGSIRVIDDSVGTCNRTIVRLESPLGTNMGEIRYVHTEPYGAGSVHNVPSDSWGVALTQQIGTTAETDTCSSNYLPHLHQGRWNTTLWSKQTQSTWIYPTRATCSQAGCTTYQSPWNYWQHERTWAANY